MEGPLPDDRLTVMPGEVRCEARLVAYKRWRRENLQYTGTTKIIYFAKTAVSEIPLLPNCLVILTAELHLDSISQIPTNKCVVGA